MARFLALTRREIAALFLRPATYFAVAFMVLLDSFAFYLFISRPGAKAVFDSLAPFLLYTSILLYPMISMHAFADENADGTIESLLTAPISRWSLLAAKYAAALLFVALSLLPSVVYALLINLGGNLDWHATLAAFIALFLTGALAMALGLCISALTVSPVAAAGATGLVLVCMALAAELDPYSGTIAAVLNAVSYLPHVKRWLAGELDSRGFIYFFSLIALFLFYTWLAIGSRGAGGKSTSRTTRRRMLVTYLLVCLGIVLVLAQAAVLHIKGFWESGSPMLAVGIRRVPWFWLIPGLLAIGLFFWSVFTYRSARRAQRQERPKPERKYRTLTESQVLGIPKLYYETNRTSRARIILAVAAALIIVVNLNWLACYPFETFANSRALYPLSWLKSRRWDLSSDKRNSLSSLTYRTLDALQGPAHIYSFFDEDYEYQGVPLTDELYRLLGRYTDYNTLVFTTYVDPEDDPERAAILAEELNVALERVKNSLIIVYQGRKLEVTPAALASPPERRPQSAARWVFDGEQGVTQALLRLLDPRVPNVFFSSGHRELYLSEMPRPEQSASRLAAALVRNNLNIRHFIVSAQQPIPESCDILAIAAPRTAISKPYVDMIRRYLDDGGRLLYIAPPQGLPEDSLAGDALNQYLFEIGGAYRFDLVEDRSNCFNSDPRLPLAKLTSTDDSDARFVFPMTRSLRDNPLSPENGWISRRLLESFPTSQAAIAGRSSPGPFTLAFRSVKTTPHGEARVAVIASSQMASDAGIGFGDNVSIITTLAQWLAGREESFAIPPRAWVDRRIALMGPEQRFILWIGLVALPLAWLLAGLTVWWLRKE